MSTVPAKLMSAEDVRRSLAVRDLTDEAQGPHAMQILLGEIVEALRGVWGCEVLTHRESPIVTLEENYDALHYPPEGASRDARYTRSPDLLEENGLDPTRVTGLAMGLGLDRLLMLRKGMGDIRLLRSGDPRVVLQVLDLSPYRPVSDQPAIARDLSIAVAEDRTVEELGDRVREALGDRSELVESVAIVSASPYCELLPAAVERLGISAGQKNALIRVVLRDLRRALTDEEANEVRDEVYAAVHESAAWRWASRSGRTT